MQNTLAYWDYDRSYARSLVIVQATGLDHEQGHTMLKIPQVVRLDFFPNELIQSLLRFQGDVSSTKPVFPCRSNANKFQCDQSRESENASFQVLEEKR